MSEDLRQWVVRGVEDELARQFVDRAARQRRTTGEVLNEVLRAYLERPEGQGGVPPAGQEGAGDLEERVATLEERVERLEASRVEAAIPGRPLGDNGEAQALAAIPGGQRRPLDAVEGVEGAEGPSRTETHPGTSGEGRRRPPRPWTDADDAVVLRIFEEGGTKADAARELGRPHSIISGRWQKLERERAGQSS